MARLVSLVRSDQLVIGDHAMRAVTVLQKLLRRSIPSVHFKRLVAVTAIVGSALCGGRLTLSALGRNLDTPCAVRHRIKRVDRLLGNPLLHGERLLFYRMLCAWLVRTAEPVILVDWSDVKSGRQWVMLRAAVWIHGCALPIYEEVHPLRRQASPRVEREFLLALKGLLGDEVRPILVTDAGFRGPWFAQVERLGWHWLGRIRGRTQVEIEPGRWVPCRALFAAASATPLDLGECRFVHARPVTGRLCLYHKPPRGRGRQSGARAPRNGREKCSAREREPWLLAASRSLDGQTTPVDLVNLYRTRMCIEHSFRTLKSHQFGFSFEDTQSEGAPRLQILLTLHALALFLLWIAGRLADQHHLRRQFESNTRRLRPTISIITLGRLALAAHAIRLRYDVLISLSESPPPLPSDQTPPHAQFGRI